MKRIIGLMLIVTFLAGCASTKVNISTNVPDAKVTIDGKSAGQTPITNVKVSNKSGRGQVIIEKEGYKTYIGTLKKEMKSGAAAAVVVGYCLSFLILPLLLCINGLYVEGPVADQYIILEKE